MRWFVNTETGKKGTGGVTRQCDGVPELPICTQTGNCAGSQCSSLSKGVM